MKKTNNKGFTLAELLIVIAIIAILIAIAIPTFSGALYNARLQTDHANIRSAHAMAMMANMDGYIDVGGSIIKPENTTVTYVFQKDGTLQGTTESTAIVGDPYYLQVTPKNKPTDCSASIPCNGINHNKGSQIKIAYQGNEWKVVLS